MKRRRAREYALQLLFQNDFTTMGELDYAHFWADKNEEDSVKEFARGIVEGTLKHLPEIDRAIMEYAENWAMDRMAAVDRNILRAGAYEILFVPDVPVKVAINEALEVAKKFSSQDSAPFINGILDRIAHKRK